MKIAIVSFVIVFSGTIGSWYWQKCEQERIRREQIQIALEHVHNAELQALYALPRGNWDQPVYWKEK